MSSSKKPRSNPKTPSKSLTERKRLETLRDEDIDTSDIPEISPEMFARSVVRKGLQPAPRKKQITLRVDEDVLVWFKRMGSGYQTHINTLLREYMKAHNAQDNNR